MKKASAKVSFPHLEEEVLAFWKDQGIFQKSQENRRGGSEFVFYDGPPFATGLPHYGHLLAGTIKDVIPRYQTMRGHFVERRFGWDCHGLPVENEIEKSLELKDRRVLAVPGSGFGTPGYFRIAYCMDDEIIEGALPALEEAIKKYQG